MKKLITLFIPFFAVLLVSAQTTRYNISVVDAANNNPVENASIKIVGRNSGVSTNQLGTATLSATPGSKIQVSSVGYNSVTVTLGAELNVTIALVAASQDLSDVVVLGTRSAARSKTSTPVPVDVIKVNQVGLPTAKMDLTSILNQAAPSLNYNRQSGSDGADHVELATLRGLSPDHTLVLINGKRRHSTASVFLFGTRGKGSSGVDLNGLPKIAIDRVEILRDGASAQYGSDAIAGVINIIFKKDVNKWNINAGWSGYYDTKFNASKFNQGNQYVDEGKIDGQVFNFEASNGFAIGKNGGFASFGVNYTSQGKTFRQADTTDWKNNKETLPFLGTARRAFGDGSLNSFGTSYNLEIPIANTKTTIYSFATVNTKESEAYAYSRNLSARPLRFPSDASGNPIFVPGIMQKTNDGETYYNPIIAANINDAAFSGGLKGKNNCGWDWDASLTTGKNDFQFIGRKTFNASLLGNTTKNTFQDGGFRFRQTTVNVDFSKSFSKVASGLNVAFGAEYRHEKYRINAGEEASYKGYANAFDLAPGAQGFPGFNPATDTLTATRYNFAAYADAELNISKNWLVNAAVRGENYSDFGGVVTYKLATRVKATDNLNIRGSYSTGFRAPSLQQINYGNTLTGFSAGQLVQQRVANNNSTLAQSAGIPKLKEETSQNASVGFAYKPAKNFTLTVDGYITKIKDRVVISGYFSQFDPTLPGNLTSALANLNVETVQFLTNAVNTTNTGIDILADYTKKWNDHAIKVLLAGNIQKAKINDINVPAALATTPLNRKTFFSDREETLMQASAPASKFNANVTYSRNKMAVGLNATLFGAIKIKGFGTETPDNPFYGGINPQTYISGTTTLIPEVFNYKQKVTVDLFGSY
jgi:iron complex outermembrane recepter protein